MERSYLDTSQNISRDINKAMRQWFDWGNKTINDASKVGQPMVDAYFRSWETLLKGYSPKNYSPKSNTGCCEVPTTDCPPYCVCEMKWEALSGEHLQGTLRVTNTSKQAQNYNFVPEAFVGPCGSSAIKTSLKPNTASIAAGDSATITVIIEVPAELQTDTYESKIKVRGLYEQCVKLQVNVKQRCKPHCDVKQGEIPKRIVEHNWYDHFQCEELCFEPISRSDNQEPNEKSRIEQARVINAELARESAKQKPDDLKG